MERQTTGSLEGKTSKICRIAMSEPRLSALGTPASPRSRWRALGGGAIVLAGFVFVAVAVTFGLAKTNPGGKDFIEYWAAEQGLIKHANPYDPAFVLRIEQAEGFDKGRPEFWYSPPPALILALPLGFLGAKTGLVAWTLFHFASLSLALWILWRLHGRPDTLLHLLGYLFAPVVLCFEAGQISILFLLSIVLFLYFMRKAWTFPAGMVLFPCVLKPHLFLVFGIALLLWIVHRKAFGIVAGFLVALVASLAATWMLDPQIWSQYRHMMSTEGMLNEYVATLSVSLRFVLNRHAIWIQFIPAILGVFWAISYFARKRGEWDWMNQGLVVLLVSVLCAPYGWFFDESLLLPAVLTAALRARDKGRSLWPIGLVSAVALVEVYESVNVMSPFYLWSTPAWLGCYLYASHKAKDSADSSTPNHALVSQ
jgi:Glycosyltransferase family 87